MTAKTTPAAFAKKMHAAATDMRATQLKVAAAGALTVKTAVTGTLRVAAPKGRLNVGKRGAKIGVRYVLLPPATARVFATGPMQLIESDTKAHRIPNPTKGRGRRQRANTAVVVIPGVGPRAYANHPGTHGKHPWVKGLAAAAPAIPRVGAKVYFDQFKKRFA